MIESLLSKTVVLLNSGRALKIATLVGFLSIVVVNMRPAIFGQKTGLVLIPFTLSIIFLILIWKAKIKVNRLVNLFFLSLILIISYVFFQVLVLGSENLIGILITLVLISIGFTPFLLGDYQSARIFAKVLVVICSLLSLSYIITYLLFFAGIKITLFEVNLSTHTAWVYKLPVLFPFSPVYNSGALVGGYMLPRAIGFLREPGLYQMVLIISYWVVEIFRFKGGKWCKGLIVISLIFTFSTAGYLLFLVTIAWRFFIKSRRKLIFIIAGLPIIAGLLYFVVTSQSQFGLARKFDNNSGRSRIEATLISLKIIEDKPLMGIGFHNRVDGKEIGINFLGTIAQLGLIGVFFFLFPFFYVFYKIRNEHVAFFCILIVLLFTMLFSQPLYDKSITYLILSFLLLCSENELQNNFKS